MTNATTNQVKPVPEGFHTVTPYLIVKDAGKAIEFYKKVFDAKELLRHSDPSGNVRHAELRIGDSPVMLGGENPEFPAYLGPEARGGTSVHMYLYVEDADALFNQAVSAGAKITMPLKNQFYGDRSGGITDPFGHSWYIATHKEDVSPEEMERRASAQGTKK